MHKRRRAAKERRKKLAKTRVGILWEQAIRESRTRPDLAKRHVRSARRIAQKVRIKLPPEMRRHICRKCDTVLVPGKNCRVRIRSNRSRHLTVTCLSCGTIRRFYLYERDTSIA